MGWATEEPWFDGPQQFQILLHSYSAKTGSRTTPTLPIRGHRALFPGDKAIRAWSWSFPSIYYHWLLRLIFVNILRSVSTVRDRYWSVGLLGSARGFSVNKIFSSLGCYATYTGSHRRFDYLVPVDPWKWGRQVVTKRRCHSTSRNIPEERRSL